MIVYLVIAIVIAALELAVIFGAYLVWCDDQARLQGQKNATVFWQGEYSTARGRWEEVTKALTEARVKIAAFDHDGDGKPGGSKPRNHIKTPRVFDFATDDFKPETD